MIFISEYRLELPAGEAIGNDDRLVYLGLLFIFIRGIGSILRGLLLRRS